VASCVSQPVEKKDRVCCHCLWRFELCESCLAVVVAVLWCKTVYLTTFGTNISRISATKEVTSYRRAIEMEASHVMDTASNSVLMWVQLWCCYCHFKVVIVLKLAYFLCWKLIATWSLCDLVKIFLHIDVVNLKLCSETLVCKLLWQVWYWVISGDQILISSLRDIPHLPPSFPLQSLPFHLPASLTPSSPPHYHYQRCASYSGTLNCPGLLLLVMQDTDVWFQDSSGHSGTVGHPRVLMFSLRHFEIHFWHLSGSIICP